MSKEALKLALKALKNSQYRFAEYGYQAMQKTIDGNKEAITACEEALAQPAPVQEPIGYWPEEYEGEYHFHDSVTVYRTPKAGWIPVYTKPPQPAPVQEPVWIQPDHLQKARKAPFLCRVEPHQRDDFVALRTTPPPPQRQWVGLTTDDIGKAWAVADGEHNASASVKKRVTRAIESQLKQKNGFAEENT